MAFSRKSYTLGACRRIKSGVNNVIEIKKKDQKESKVGSALGSCSFAKTKKLLVNDYGNFSSHYSHTHKNKANTVHPSQ